MQTTLSGQGRLIEELIIRAFVKHVVQVVAAVRGERGPLNYIMIVVDGVLEIEDLQCKGDVGSRMFSTATLQTNILSEPFVDQHITLLISSLTIDAIDFAVPSR